jgi:hypothetical protein
MNFRILDGLPVYGPMATPFPPEWGRYGREGLVVQFEPSTGDTWTGNFRPGYCGIDDARQHPDGCHVLVTFQGAMWVVDPDSHDASELWEGVFDLWEVADPAGVVLSLDGIAFARLGPAGIIWRSKRLSWDGFEEVRIEGENLVGLGWSLGDSWLPFRVDLRTGQAVGGGYLEPDA